MNYVYMHVYVSMSLICEHMHIYIYTCRKCISGQRCLRNTGLAKIHKYRTGKCGKYSDGCRMLGLPFQIKNLNKLSDWGRKNRLKGRKRQEALSGEEEE